MITAAISWRQPGRGLPILTKIESYHSTVKALEWDTSYSVLFLVVGLAV
jgi:hypothetical protein